MTRLIKPIVVAALVVAAMAVSAGTFDAAVWRGETAYVNIPDGVKGKWGTGILLRQGYGGQDGEWGTGN